MCFRCGPECVFMPTTCDCLLFTLPGTCINNTGVFMFKKGCFELGATIYPAVIKVSGMWRPFPIPCHSLVNHLLPTFHSHPVHRWTSLPSHHMLHNIALMNMCAMQGDVMSCWLCRVGSGSCWTLPAVPAQTLQGNNKPHWLVLLRTWWHRLENCYYICGTRYLYTIGVCESMDHACVCLLCARAYVLCSVCVMYVRMYV